MHTIFCVVPTKIWLGAAQVISAVNGPGLLLQLNLVEAAQKAANPTLQFIPSEFSAYGAVGEPCIYPCMHSRDVLPRS